MNTTPERTMKEILREYSDLRKKNDDRICDYIANAGYSPEYEKRKIETIEENLRKERELALEVIRIIDTVTDPRLRWILELRYLNGLDMSEITKEFYGKRKDFGLKEEKYRRMANHSHGLALRAAELAVGQKEKAGPDTDQPVLRHATTQIIANERENFND